MFHSPEDYQLTVAGLVIRPVTPTSSPYPPVLLQWPTKAAQQLEGNLNTVQEGIGSRTLDPITAIKRALRQKYKIQHSTTYPLNHRRFRSPDHKKEYLWFLIVCEDPVVLVPDPTEAAAADWYYCPQTLVQGVQQMHKKKGRMFTEVFALACEQHPEHFGGYVQYVVRQRKRQRRAAERLAWQRLQTNV